MATQKLKWRIAAKILAATVILSVPVLALTFFGSPALTLLQGSTTEIGEFRVVSPTRTPFYATKTVDAVQTDDETEVQLTTWEKTGGGTSHHN